MALYEEENTNERDISISKESIDKSNSLFIKSLNEEEFNFIDLLKDKMLLSIVINKTKNIYQISNKSIFKIFYFFCDSKNLESILSDYITFNVLDDNESFKEDFNLNNPDNSLGVLDAPFVKLLEYTKNYKISITANPMSPLDEIKKELLNYEIQQNKVNISANSIKKICKYLNKSIYDISDYINILVLYLNEDDVNKAVIQAKIIDKYNQAGLNSLFMGKKNFDADLKIPLKNFKNNLYKYDDLFESTLNKIENIENNSSEYNFEENKDKIINNDDIIDTPKKFIEQKIKINKVNYDDEDNNEDKLDSKNKCNCQKDICSFCNIF